MPRQNPRSLRVAAELQRLLNELLQSGAKDPRLAGVRVTDVEVSGDLGVATIYFSPLDIDESPADALTAFARATGFFRSRIARELRLRRVPELRFIHDDSARHGIELSRLIEDNAPVAGNDDEPS